MLRVSRVRIRAENFGPAVTAWRLVKTGMKLAGLAGLRVCSRGLRHAFGVSAWQGGAPLNLIQRWMGHRLFQVIHAHPDSPILERSGACACKSARREEMLEVDGAGVPEPVRPKRRFSGCSIKPTPSALTETR